MTKASTTSGLSIGFYGAAGTVTGSKYLVKSGQRSVLIDCGMFQGVEETARRNRQPLPFDPQALDAVVLTHAHLDHSGMLPVLHKEGFTGPVYCTASTEALLGVLLPDSGRIQENAARTAENGKLDDRPNNQPLYTEQAANACLDLLRPVPFDSSNEILPGLTFRLRRSGHILGAGWLQLEMASKRLTFSGDLGRPDDSVMHTPERLERTDYLVVESTYGDRTHGSVKPDELMAEVIHRTARRGGVVIIPAFAVGRAQLILYYLWRLKCRGELADIPVYLDSPMALAASRIFRQHTEDHKLSPAEAEDVCNAATPINTPEESRALNGLSTPAVIVSASGMLSGGRILHHLRAHIGNPKNTILFTGYQARDTRGAKVLAGDKTVDIQAERYPVLAEVCELPGLSAHADADEIIRWLQGSDAAPRRTFVSHGEPAAAAALRDRVHRELGWAIDTPELDVVYGLA